MAVNRNKDFNDLSADEQEALLKLEAEREALQKKQKELAAKRRQIVAKPKQTKEERDYKKKRSYARNFLTLSTAEDTRDVIARAHERLAELGE